MFGIFDLKYHETWSKNVAQKYMIKNRIKYSLEPMGRDKGCFDTIVKLGKRNVIKLMNSKSQKAHGCTLHCTIKVQIGQVRDKTFCRKPGIFYPGFLHQTESSDTKPISYETTKEMKEDIQRLIQNYDNGNIINVPLSQDRIHPLHTYNDTTLTTPGTKDDNTLPNGNTEGYHYDDTSSPKFDNFAPVTIPQGSTECNIDLSKDCENMGMIIDGMDDLEDSDIIFTPKEDNSMTVQKGTKDRNYTIDNARNIKILNEVIQNCEDQVQHIRDENDGVIIAGVKESVVKHHNREIRKKS